MAVTVNLPDNPNAEQLVQLGKDFFLYIDTSSQKGTPEWTLVGAQRNTSLKRTAEEIDVSHKTSGGWKAAKAGMRQWSMEMESLVLLDDKGGLAISKAFMEGKEVHVRFVYPTAQKLAYNGWASITDYSLDTSHDDVATLSVTFAGNGALAEEKLA